MRNLVFGIVGTAALASSAFAADLPVKAPPMAPPPPTWTGCYVGGNAGWLGGDETFNTTPDGGYRNPAGAVAPPNAAGTGLIATDPPFLSHGYATRPNGALAGIQVGCNQQAGRFVIGVEGDWQWTSEKSSINALYPAFADPGAPAFTIPAHLEHVSSSLRSFATFRGRAGFDFNNILFYGTGGLAIGDIHSDTNVTFGTFPVLPVLNGAVHLGSSSDVRVGWTAGAGAEWMFAPNWSVKFEYLYADFGTTTYSSPLVAAVAPAVVHPGYAWQTSVRDRENIVRVGVNYKFWPWGGGPVVASY